MNTNPKSFAAFRRRWRLRLILWLAKDAGLTAHRYSVASKRGEPIDKRGLILMDEGALEAMKVSFRVGFCNVAQSFLDEPGTLEDARASKPKHVPRVEGSRDQRNNPEARLHSNGVPPGPIPPLPPRPSDEAHAAVMELERVLRGWKPFAIPVTEIRDGDTLVFRLTKFAQMDEVEPMRSRITQALLPTEVKVFFVGVGDTTELIHVIRPAPKLEIKAPDLDPATANANLKAAGLA